MVRIPASWVTSSGWPARLATSSDGGSWLARMATEPQTTRTLRAATPPRSMGLGESMVQRGIAVLPRGLCASFGRRARAGNGLHTYDISCWPLHQRSVAAGPVPAAGPRRLVFVVVQAGEPAGQPVDLRLGVRVQVDELAQPLGQPAQRDLVLAAPVGEFLQAAVGEVHRAIPWISRSRPGVPAPPRAVWPSRRRAPRTRAAR